MIDRLVTPVKADRMIRIGPDDAFDTAKPRRFKDVPHADYIGAKDRLPGRFTRAATKMQDTVDAFNRGANCIEVAEVNCTKLSPSPRVLIGSRSESSVDSGRRYHTAGGTSHWWFSS